MSPRARAAGGAAKVFSPASRNRRPGPDAARGVKVFNRRTESIELEEVSDALSYLYRTKPGLALANGVLNRRVASLVYGWFARRRRSVSRIPRFIERHGIDVDEMRRPLDSYRSFNDFFIRELKEGARPIDPDPEHLISPADSRLLIVDLAKHANLPVKGYSYTLGELLKDEGLAADFAGGWCFIYRLSPSDHHRYCYIDAGRHDTVKTIPGVLHSVHPVALSAVGSLLAGNYRELTILETETFGRVIDLEVGALCVGRVVQRNRRAHVFTRGEEKGWFEFGGSTIIQLFGKDAAIPDPDILGQSADHVETMVRLGERVGVASTPSRGHRVAVERSRE